MDWTAFPRCVSRRLGKSLRAVIGKTEPLSKSGAADPANTAKASASYRKAGRVEESRAIVARALALYPTDVPLLVEWAISDNFLDESSTVTRSWDGHGRDLRPIEIVICVHNALDAFKNCMDALLSNVDSECYLTVIDDYSEEGVGNYIAEVAANHSWIRVIRNAKNLGYTRSANLGIRAARSDWIVLLNSDTIVTRGWLDGLIECARSDAAIRAVGPLSNSATVQSVPEVYDSRGNFAENALAPGVSPEDVAALVRSVSSRAFPRVPLLNGFCLLLHKPTIDEIGNFDESNFPRGYGEENDLCLRLVKAGYKLAIADHVYVYHAKTASFSREERRILTEEAAKRLSSLWKRYSYRTIAAAIDDLPALTDLRSRLRTRLADSG